MSIRVSQVAGAIALIAALIIVGCTQPSQSSGTQARPKGTLVIIGGGSRDSTIMKEVIRLSGWKRGDWIAIASMASRWDSAYVSMNDEFRFYTRSDVRCVRVDSNTVRRLPVLDSLRKSKIIYLNGGDQSVFMKHIDGTNFKEVINKAYREGAVIVGTSAGAALMSEQMITGNQLESGKYTSAVPVIHANNMEVAEGLGFLHSVVIDQHFIVRSRSNRLLSIVLDHPGLDGIGIDESTAIVVHDGTASVIGLGQVIVYRSPGKVTRGKSSLIGTSELKLSVYLPGDEFPIRM
ncbi:MAG: cyanophycinase [Bacteroidetes bacterium]|nr:cyanophycinase [Bacteroidota bacterium]